MRIAGIATLTAVFLLSACGSGSDPYEDTSPNDINEVTGTDEVDGEETVTVSFESDEGNAGVAHVLASDPHYVVKMEVEEQGDLAFSEFDEPVEPEAPSDTIDLA